MNELSHEEAVSELAAVALDSVAAETRDSVRAHASICPECGPELAAMQATVAALGHLVPSRQMNRGRSAGIRSRLVMRARAERELQSVALPGRPDITRGVASLTGLGHRATPGAQRAVSGEMRRVTPAQPMKADVTEAPARSMNWLAIAAAVAFVAAAAQLFRVTSDRNTLRDRMAAVDTLAPRADSLQSMVMKQDAMIVAMSGPDVRVVPLTHQTAREPLGRMTWNPVTDDWVMVTYGLRQPREGMTFQVWLVTDNARISAGTFRPDRDGRSIMHARHDMPRNALRAVAITEEPEGGTSVPTGPTVAAGSA